tara:strand:- start:123 stop:575 length:453 start_codon:yes stop_codon:yes gene_type:complete
MKKIITFTWISIFCILSLSAQERKVSRDKIKTLKISYLTEKLNLTPSEAEKFWPIYNIYNNNNRILRGKIRLEINKVMKENRALKSISEENAAKLVYLKLGTEKKIYEAHENFIVKLKTIISYNKIIQLEVAEMEFGRKLMKRYRSKKRK